MKRKYPVVTLCGSTKFKEDFEDIQKELTLRGYIVISVGLFGHSGDKEGWENKEEGSMTATKIMLDDIHKEKINMADSIYVINPDGYIGKSTWSEICYAKMIGKPIDSMSSIPEYEIDARVEDHIKKAKLLAWAQLDHIRHRGAYYNLNDYVYFVHKKSEIFDPWISVDAHYNGTPWADHDDPEQKVDPFAYYGKEKVAAFIEKIVMLHGDNYEDIKMNLFL